MKKPRSSRLSLQTKLNQVIKQRDTYLEALETIADVLEEVGILDGEEDVEDPPEPEGAEPEIIPGTAEKVE